MNAIPKINLSLLSGASNVLNIPQSTVDGHKIPEEEVGQIMDSVSLFIKKVGGHWTHDIVKKQLDNNFKNIDVVSLKKYPLPAVFNRRTNRMLFNMNAFGRRSPLNISTRDLYASLVYAYLVAYFTVKKIDPKMYDTIADYMSAIFIRMFAKQYGLVGSFQEEIPRLRFLVNTFTFVSFFGVDQKLAYGKAGSLAKSKKSAFPIDLDKYDLYDIRQLIQALSDTGVLHGISTHEFASKVIRIFNGPIALPLFEDGMRFMATMGASSISATSIFPQSLDKYQPTLYQKFLNAFERL
jgi:hypothetical protein